MRRMVLTLALTAGMIFGGASVAMAHPNDPGPTPFNADNAVAKKGLATAKGPTVTATYELPDGSFVTLEDVNRGIAQGYFVHGPTCALHPALSH